ncbi:MAG: uppP [Rickettsiaceae bacterium]|jgi:undecaprenyl-diphosphatase|nr:uppP [Rickettsiaceae bacterium]
MDIITILQAALLGMVEGLTEFIPVSSTGHLILLIDILGFKSPPGKTFEIIIQLGAILAVCWLYRQKIIDVVIGLPKDKNAQKFTINICLAFLPAAVLGVLFHGFIKNVLFSPYVVCASLIIGGFIILLIEKNVRTPKYNSVEAIGWKTALSIGFAQSVAMIPGVSRSGATIMGSLLLGVDRKTATEFSFFLAIPTMLGATVFDIYKNRQDLSFDNVGVIAVGFIAAFLSAMLVVKTVITFVSNNGFKPFAYYRIILGIVMLALLSS